MNPKELEEGLRTLTKSVFCLIDIITRAREISPEVSARINEIMDEVEEAYYTKTHKKPSAV